MKTTAEIRAAIMRAAGGRDNPQTPSYQVGREIIALLDDFDELVAERDGYEKLYKDLAADVRKIMNKMGFTDDLINRLGEEAAKQKGWTSHAYA